MYPQLKATACALVLLMLGSGAVRAETPSPAPLPNGAPGTPGALESRALPPGLDTGLPAGSRSMPLGTPAEPPVLVSPGTRDVRRGDADASRPPVLTQDPISRSRPHRSDADESRPADRGAAPDGGPETARHAPASTATRDVGDFPPGLSRCIDRTDRAERAACARELYESGKDRR